MVVTFPTVSDRRASVGRLSLVSSTRRSAAARHNSQVASRHAEHGRAFNPQLLIQYMKATAL
ncbi:hypothetical protein E2C01_033136 [Portunus trituberculatus]|uniref:Uncharacterized protein n=1 Tax=Portunus trituberculatus TaxID=210409 RepID=A0A5B7F1M9_PORTR|nr:hypothetical protein [Portunus trituberculatus]